MSDVRATLSTISLPATLDVINIEKDYFSARAMWRLTSWPAYLGVHRAQKFWLFNGITPDNYFLVWPRSTQESIRQSMKEIYRAWFNEHTYHSLYTDLPSELAALAASLDVDWFHAHFTISNMRHHDRLEWFKKIQKSKLFIFKHESKLR